MKECGQRLRDVHQPRPIALLRGCHEAVFRDCPRADQFFDEYDLRLSMDHKHAVRAATVACCIRDRADHLVLYPRKKRLEQEKQLKAMYAEVNRVADEFMVYQAKHEEAWRRHNCEVLSHDVNAYRQFTARDRLMAVPAPDTAALLVKIDVGTGLGDDYDDAIRADAHRLITAGSRS